ncbi:MAG: hypothetical protein IPO52_10205 [Gemmatimonadetes bacterium]|nr:hypothetical protein [Gemmatimonadota bacterium]
MSDRLLRGALWATVALNTLGVIIFALPALGPPLLPVPPISPPDRRCSGVCWGAGGDRP